MPIIFKLSDSIMVPLFTHSEVDPSDQNTLYSIWYFLLSNESSKPCNGKLLPVVPAFSPSFTKDVHPLFLILTLYSKLNSLSVELNEIASR